MLKILSVNNYDKSKNRIPQKLFQADPSDLFLEAISSLIFVSQNALWLITVFTVALDGSG